MRSGCWGVWCCVVFVGVVLCVEQRAPERQQQHQAAAPFHSGPGRAPIMRIFLGSTALHCTCRRAARPRRMTTACERLGGGGLRVRQSSVSATQSAAAATRAARQGSTACAQQRGACPRVLRRDALSVHPAHRYCRAIVSLTAIECVFTRMGVQAAAREPGKGRATILRCCCLAPSTKAPLPLASR